MNWFITGLPQLGVIVLGTLCGVAIAALFAWIAGIWRPGEGKQGISEFRRNILLAAALALLGSVAGVSGGISRESVVGDIIPAALTLAGGVSLYLFGVEKTRGLTASVCAVAFAVGLGVAYTGGAETRGRGDVERNFLAFCRERLGNVDLLKDNVAYCRFQSTFGETCAHYIAKEIAADDTAQSDVYTRQAHYTDVYVALMYNLDHGAAQTPSQPACKFMMFDRDSEAAKGRFKKFPTPGVTSAKP